MINQKMIGNKYCLRNWVKDTWINIDEFKEFIDHLPKRFTPEMMQIEILLGCMKKTVPQCAEIMGIKVNRVNMLYRRINGLIYHYGRITISRRSLGLEER
jgi:hypothetical protein